MEVVYPGDKPQATYIDFGGGFCLYIMFGTFGDYLKRWGRNPKQRKTWFDDAPGDMASQMIWPPVKYQDYDTDDDIELDLTDVMAQAAWCLVKNDVAAQNVQEFLFQYARYYLGPENLGLLFTGNYQGHLTPLSLKAYLRMVSRRQDMQTGMEKPYGGQPGHFLKGSDPNLGLKIFEYAQARQKAGRTKHRVTTASARNRAIEASEDWPKSVIETARLIDVPPRTLYHAIEKGIIECNAYMRTYKARETPWGSYDRDPYSVQWTFEKEHMEAAKDYFKDKEKRRLIVNAYAEKRNISADSARRWVQLQEKKGLSLKEIAKKAIGGKKSRKQTGKKATKKPAGKKAKGGKK